MMMWLQKYGQQYDGITKRWGSNDDVITKMRSNIWYYTVTILWISLHLDMYNLISLLKDIPDENDWQSLFFLKKMCLTNRIQ